jgi:thiamine-monophosphate kinase
VRWKFKLPGKTSFPVSEFSLIEKYFSQLGERRGDVALGVGDDAAVLEIPAGEQLVMATDTLIAGVHFPLQTSAYDIGFKSLAVNLSDLAAMGATPAWATIALTMPAETQAWVESFARGVDDIARIFDVAIVGGDTTRGALGISVTLCGTVPAGQAITRAKAQVGDRIFVSGSIGNAGLALYLSQHNPLLLEQNAELLRSLNQPQPRIQLGEMLRGIASAAIDISDGLLADLNHILQQSEVGAELERGAIPLDDATGFILSEINNPLLPFNSGDDYELLFTVPSDRVAELHKIVDENGIRISEIGVVTRERQLVVHGLSNAEIDKLLHGYDHFREVTT